jgi:SAM-dependent methyltransferase
MPQEPFDEYADKYDAWFLQNRNVLQSEVLLLKQVLGDPGHALSVGCGSGLFEHLLRTDHGIDIRHGVEPAEGMAEIARKRGMDVVPGSAEQIPLGDEEFDTVIMNGTPGYIAEFVASANWRTTEEKADLLQEVGFTDLSYQQTLTAHPKYSNDRVEQPSEGFDRGDYVAIRGLKP